MADEKPPPLPAVQEIIVPGELPKNVGKPPHQPTDKDRAIAQLGAAVGMPHDEIAKNIGISAKTLREHYRDELDQGKAKANMMVAGKLYNACKDGNIAAIIFWCKTQMNFTEEGDRTGLEPIDITEASKEVLRQAIEDADAEF